MSELMMQKIEVPADIARIIMCKKHEAVVGNPDPLTLEIFAACKHCKKIMGSRILEPEEYALYVKKHGYG